MTKCLPIYEFIVWENCNNNCDFCFQRANPKLFNQDQRKQAIENVLKFIDSDQFLKNSHLLIVGGEIFHLTSEQEQETLVDFYNQVINHMKNNDIGLLYINTNLIYEDLTLIKKVLTNFENQNLLDRVRFTTSYDLDGRYKTEEIRQKFINNLKDIRANYPKLHMVANTILTKKVCDLINSGELSIKNLMKDFGCWVNLVPYIVYDKKLSATREAIFNALQAVEEENEGYIAKYVKNLSLDQEKRVYINNNGKYDLCMSEKNKCGHSINFNRYSENGSCYICDLKECFNGLL